MHRLLFSAYHLSHHHTYSISRALQNLHLHVALISLEYINMERYYCTGAKGVTVQVLKVLFYRC
jgi:hypothetical protein